MRHFMALASTALLMLVSQASFASAPIEDSHPATAQYPTYSTGTYSLSFSSIGFGYGSASGIFMTMSPRIEYFVLDRLAVGVQAKLYTTAFSSSSTSFSVGPAATYHFWNDQHWSAYGGTAFVFNILNPPLAASQTLQLSLGGNYNFSNRFGIGPRFSLNTDFTGGMTSSSIVVNYINLFFYF